jgi:integrase
MHDVQFTSANQVFTGKLRRNKAEGKDVTKHKTSIIPEDLEKLYSNYFAKYESDAVVLLHKVFFDIMYYTGRRGREGLRELEQTHFSVLVNAKGEEYVQIKINEKTKRDQGDSMSNNSIYDVKGILLQQAGLPTCPVKSFKLYQSLINSSVKAFFQKPSRIAMKYEKCAVGKNTLGTMLKTISTNAGLSQIYTNHCTRKTTAVNLKKSGFSLEEIAHITGHKNLQSLKSYLDGPDQNQLEKYSNALHKNVNSNDPAPPCNEPKKRKIDVEATLSVNPEQNEGTDIDEKNELDLAIVSETNDKENAVISKNLVQNNQQIKQAPMLFGGANFSNCSFNFTMH